MALINGLGFIRVCGLNDLTMSMAFGRIKSIFNDIREFA